MKRLSVSTIRELIGDCNRSITDADNQLIEVEERINKLNEMLSDSDFREDRYELNLQLNSLLLKKEVLKSDVINYEEKINICNKLLYDFALNSVLNDENLLNRVSEQLIYLKNTEVSELNRDNEYYSKQLDLRKKCCSLYSFKGRNYMFESLVSTPISKEQYVKYFIIELNESGLVDSIFDLMMKYDKKISNYIEEFKNIDTVNEVDKFFDEHSLKPEWKQFFSSMKFYSEVLESYKFIEKLENDILKDDKLDYFDDKTYFPGFKFCTKEDILDYYESLEDGKLKDYISQFDFDNLSSLDIYCIIFKLNNNHKFILKSDNFIYENDQEIYKLAKLVSINDRVIEEDKKLIEKLEDADKRKAISNYFGGLFLHHDFLPIDSNSNLIVDDVNKIVDNFDNLVLEKNKILDMIKCYEDGPLYPLFLEFGSNKTNCEINDNVISLDDLKSIVIDINNFNLNIRRKKNDINDLLNIVEKLNKNVEESKKNYDEFLSSQDDMIYTNSRGKVVKNKFLRFFFKFFKQYKENVRNFESQKNSLENKLSSLKEQYNFNYENLTKYRENLDKLNSEKDDYILKQNSINEGVVDKAFRYNSYLDNNGYDMYTNYLHLKKDLESKKDEINLLRKTYMGRISELLCISNLPKEYVENINNIVDENKVVKVDYVDKKYTDYFSMIYNKYKSDSFAFESLINDNYDYNMDSEEAIYGLVGKRKKKFR